MKFYNEDIEITVVNCRSQPVITANICMSLTAYLLDTLSVT